MKDTFRQVADSVWDRKTIPEACKIVGLDESSLTAVAIRFLIDVSMVARYRDEDLPTEDLINGL